MSKQKIKLTQKTISNVSGINNRDFEQLLKSAVVKLVNYWKSGLGEIRKAPGLDLQYQITTGVDAGTAPTILAKWFPNYEVIGYGNVIKVRDYITGVTIDVKDNFTAEVTDGVKYGGYFYVADGNDGNKIGYLKATLAYDAQTANFTVGKMITQAVSNAKAVILADTDAGATGTLTLKILSGSFVNDQIITDNNSTPGSAMANGTIAVTWTEIADAPACKVLTIANGNRLGAGNTGTDVSEVHISRADTLTGVPFSAAADWTVGTFPASPFKKTFSDGAEVKSFGKLGSQTVVLLDDGKFGFRITQIDVSGIGLTLDTPTDFQNIDFGASGKTVSTSIGIIYTNEAGVWIMTSGGLTDQPYSAQNNRISKPLGREFTRDFTFDGSDIVVDDDNELVLITCRDNSSTNNTVLVYHLSKELRGWSIWQKTISRFRKDGKDIYCADSGSTSVFKLDYDLGADNDNEIPTEIVIEFQTGGTESLVSPKEVSIAGKIGSGTDIELSIDTFDRTWAFTSYVPLNGNGDTSYHFTTSGVTARLPAIGSGGIGSAGIGGRGVGEGHDFIYARGQRSLGMSDYMRVRLRATSFDKYTHTLNLLTLFLEPRGLAETSNLT